MKVMDYMAKIRVKRKYTKRSSCWKKKNKRRPNGQAAKGIKRAIKSKENRVYNPNKSSKESNNHVLELVNLVKTNNDEFAFREIEKMLKGYLQHLSLKKFFYVAGNSSDDIYQEGLMALATKAIPDYKEKKGSFLGFAKLCIRRHIITLLKASNNYKHRILNKSKSMDDTVKDEEGALPMSHLIASDEEQVLERICRGENNVVMAKLLMDKLTGLENKVLGLYLKNMSYVDIVKVMNKRRRRKNRVDCKVIDNALCRIKKKAVELEQEMNPNKEKKDEDQC